MADSSKLIWETALIKGLCPQLQLSTTSVPIATFQANLDYFFLLLLFPNGTLGINGTALLCAGCPFSAQSQETG